MKFRRLFGFVVIERISVCINREICIALADEIMTTVFDGELGNADFNVKDIRNNVYEVVQLVLQFFDVVYTIKLSCDDHLPL